MYLATASVDRLDMFGRLNRDHIRLVHLLSLSYSGIPSSSANMIRDLRFSGFVAWTGNSSMEVVVKMSASSSDPKEEDRWKTLMLGRFAMVCRDARTHKARKVPGLIVETEEEKALWDIGEGESHKVLTIQGE